MKILHEAEKKKNKIVPSLGLAKELIIVNDTKYQTLDITAIIYDPDEERKYPGNKDAYGINFLLTQNQMKELSALIDTWEQKNKKYTVEKKLLDTQKLLMLYKERLEKNNELLEKYRTAIKDGGMSMADFWSCLQKKGRLVITAHKEPKIQNDSKPESTIKSFPEPESLPESTIKSFPEPESFLPIKKINQLSEKFMHKPPYKKDIPYDKPHTIWGSRDYRPSYDPPKSE